VGLFFECLSEFKIYKFLLCGKFKAHNGPTFKGTSTLVCLQRSLDNPKITLSQGMGLHSKPILTPN